MGCSSSKPISDPTISAPIHKCFIPSCDLPATQKHSFCVNHDPRNKARSLK